MKSFVDFLAEERVTTQYNLRALYSELNRTLFGGELPDVPIAFGKTPKSAAATTMSRVVRPSGTPLWMRKTIPGSTTVTVRPHTYEEDVLKGLVAHEMIHVWCHVNDRHEKDNHGAGYMAKHGAIQRKAAFKIPLDHNTEDDEHGAARELPFIAAVRDNGKRIVMLFSKALATRADSLAQAQTQCDYLVNDRKCAWAAYGMCKTALGNTFSVAREFKYPNAYAVDSFKLLGVQRLFYMNGTPKFD